LERRNQVRKTFETPGPIDVRVRLTAGELEVEAADTGETVVEVEPRNAAAEELVGEVRVELEESRLVVEAPNHRGGFGGEPEFELRVRCPSASSLQAVSASADIRSSGRLRDLDIKTASGDVQAQETDGESRIVTASGDIELGTSRGPVKLTTASGDIDVRCAAAGLHANLASGDLSADEADGGVQVNTASGDVDLAAVGPGPVRINTASGDVSVAVRRGLDVWMDVKSLSGDTRSELDELEGPPADRSKLVEIRINTTSGDVSIGRASSPAVS
jgi:hypothetical protein